MKRYAKEIIFDIETTNLNADIGIVLTFSWKERGSKKPPKVIGIQDYDSFKKEPWNDKSLLLDIFSILSSADSLIYHYGDGFDLPFLKTRLLKHGLFFPKVHSVDTWKVAKKHLKLQRNSLKNIAEYLGVKEKMHVDKETWKLAGFGNLSALKILKKRAKSDVETLDEILTKMIPYCKFINKNLFFKDAGCPNCGSKRVHSDGKAFFVSDATLRRMYECQECKTKIKGEIINNGGKYRHA